MTEWVLFVWLGFRLLFGPVSFWSEAECAKELRRFEDEVGPMYWEENKPVAICCRPGVDGCPEFIDGHWRDTP